MGATYYNSRQGYVNIYSGADYSLIRQRLGEYTNGQFGFAICQAGDTTGDGVCEYAVSAPRVDQGYVYFYNGATGARLWKVSGPADGKFGDALAGIGDFNGDGDPDILAGAPYEANGELGNAGAVHVLSGSNGAILLTLRGESASGLFGYSLANVGDINGDGKIDFSVGAPETAPNGVTNGGTVCVHSGLDGSLLYRCDGQYENDSLGSSLSTAGDANGDGVPDFVVGAKMAWGLGILGAGSAFVRSGSVLALHTGASVISAATGGSVPFMLDAGAGAAGRSYFILGSASGMSPGMQIGGVHLDLNFDPFTSLVIKLANTPAFANFFSTLDGNGQATATFDTLGPFDPGFAGVQIWFAFLLVGPIDYASNSVPIEIMP
ncbi:MAG: VCBS repeat-containing protein [Planctomycetota bacterium]